MIHEFGKDKATSHTESECPFRILCVYDSAQASVDAARASAIVVRELGDDISVDRCSWDLSSLEDIETRGLAAGEAARADLIVIALSAVLPTQALKDWVAQWQKKRQLSGGLLALIPSGAAGQASDLEEYFYETAITANMDFLCRKNRRY